MTDDLTPREEAARAVADFDRAMHDPSRTVDPVGALFRALGAATARHVRDNRAARVRRQNTPEAKAARSAAAMKAAATRKANREAERAAWAAEEERDARVPTVHCRSIDFVPYGSGEVECIGEPGHRDDHEDIDGHAWPNDCDGTCEGDCEC
ncbi:hypothetical protein [Streptomyces sp. AMCC400023]|uniref:hypothetical protein n=1 Tax=Streptomyces sp. AMCC400023 TaxID=2056258 RepID=UPI001F36019C|nr:hypothetical protein [Streptomyces sp. AMCC400023]UJV42928.1 hypothetical protein CVT30_26575 [Streptomyces sp. AMCC400023]